MQLGQADELFPSLRVCCSVVGRAEVADHVVFEGTDAAAVTPDESKDDGAGADKSRHIPQHQGNP